MPFGKCSREIVWMIQHLNVNYTNRYLNENLRCLCLLVELLTHFVEKKNFCKIYENMLRKLCMLRPQIICIRCEKYVEHLRFMQKEWPDAETHLGGCFAEKQTSNAFIILETNLAIIIQKNTFPKNGANTHTNTYSVRTSDWLPEFPFAAYWKMSWWIFLSGNDRQGYYVLILNSTIRTNKKSSNSSASFCLNFIKPSAPRNFRHWWLSPRLKKRIFWKYAILEYDWLALKWCVPKALACLFFLFRFIFSFELSVITNSVERKYEQQVHAVFFYYGLFRLFIYVIWLPFHKSLFMFLFLLSCTSFVLTKHLQWLRSLPFFFLCEYDFNKTLPTKEIRKNIIFDSWEYSKNAIFAQQKPVYCCHKHPSLSI